MHELRANSPFRPLSWRWQLAVELRKANRLPSRDADEWVHRAYDYHGKFAAVERDPWARADLAGECPDEHDAHALMTDRKAGDTRYELEARILAGQEPYDIAYSLEVAPGVTKAYEAMFFHVQDRLQARSWVAHSVLGPAYWSGPSARDHALFWKLIGYVHGVEALEWYMGFQSRTKAERGKERQRYEEESRDGLARKAWLSTQTLSVNSHSQVMILDLLQKTRQVELEFGAGNSQHELLDAFGNMLESIPWRVGQPYRQIEAHEGQVSDVPAAEPRANQMIASAAGVQDAGSSRFTVPVFPESRRAEGPPTGR